jgi:hypothetical protein
VVKDDVFNEWAEATKARNRRKVKEIILRVAKEQAGRDKMAAR